MSDFQKEKSLVLNFINKVDKASEDNLIEILSKYTSNNFNMKCTHPFNEIKGIEEFATKFWFPIKKSFKPIQRRMDIFYAGTNLVDNHSSKWVVNMGHLLGNFNFPFFDIKPNFKTVMLWYCEFYKVEDNKIQEGAFFLDILKFMQYLNLSVIPESTGMIGFNPGPKTHQGLCFEKQSEIEGKKTLELITRMANRLIGEGMRTTIPDLQKDWHEDMIWWGPGGIGASYTYEGYLKGHTGPFEDNLDFIDFSGHILENSEGNYGGWFGWPNLKMKPKGNYMGFKQNTNLIGEMRVVDLYRRDGDKIAENWILIDHLHFLNCVGIDLLERNKNEASK